MVMVVLLTHSFLSLAAPNSLTASGPQAPGSREQPADVRVRHEHLASWPSPQSAGAVNPRSEEASV